ncbi:MAG: hypothetical protein E7254_05875 [Lachnospiraceae bacterium]|nr:hypothetical protein [Lachnospiraceae bacterium]
MIINEGEKVIIESDGHYVSNKHVWFRNVQQKVSQEDEEKGEDVIITALAALVIMLILSSIFKVILSSMYSIKGGGFLIITHSIRSFESFVPVYFFVVSYFIANTISKRITTVTGFSFSKKAKKSTLIFWGIIAVLILYWITTNKIVISEDRIMVHTTFHPLGKEYRFTEIKEIKEGRYEDGEEYYILVIDGKEYNLKNAYIKNKIYKKNKKDYLSDIDRIIIDGRKNK